MTARAQVVAAARDWLGVPWRHQGRTRDGIDCVGLVIVVARALALAPAERIDAIEREAAGYSRYPRGQALRELLGRDMSEIPAAAARAGDVVLFRIDLHPQHVAIVGDHPLGGRSLIHAYARSPRRVVETVFDGIWLTRVVAAFALPGVE